jgi:hypothetical protein
MCFVPGVIKTPQGLQAAVRATQAAAGENGTGVSKLNSGSFYVDNQRGRYLYKEKKLTEVHLENRRGAQLRWSGYAPHCGQTNLGHVHGPRARGGPSPLLNKL